MRGVKIPVNLLRFYFGKKTSLFHDKLKIPIAISKCPFFWDFFPPWNEKFDRAVDVVMVDIIQTWLMETTQLALEELKIATCLRRIVSASKQRERAKDKCRIRDRHSAANSCLTELSIRLPNTSSYLA